MNDSGLKKLGFGAMRLPLKDKDDPKNIDHAQLCRMVDLYMERGFRYFDTAYPYHGECSEDALRRCLVERYPRDRFLLADKMPTIRVREKEDYERFFPEQLRRCGVDYFDVYLLHNLGRDRYIVNERCDGFAFLRGLKEKGLARKIGFSFHDSADMLDRILTEHPEVDLVQLQINYLDWDGAVAQSGRCYETAAAHGKQVIVMEPVKGGTLANLPPAAAKLFSDYYGTGKDAPSPASLAVRYAASLDRVKVVLSGMSNLAQVEDNTSYMDPFTPLSDGERALAERIAGEIRKAVRVECTSCRYCTEVCPKDIPIPDYFGLLNLNAMVGYKSNMYYQRFSMNKGRASDCLKCGLCEKNCPQHLPIRERLEEFAALYEAPKET